MGLEDRIHDFDGHSGHNAVSYFRSSPAFMEIFVYSLQDSFLEGGFMGSSIRSVLSIYITMVAFAISIGMGKGKLKVPAFVVNERIEAVISKNLLYKIHETTGAFYGFSIKRNDEAFIKVGVVPESFLYVVFVIGIFAENGRVVIGDEGNEGSVGFFTLSLFLMYKLPPFEDSVHILPFSPGSDLKV